MNIRLSQPQDLSVLRQHFYSCFQVNETYVDAFFKYQFNPKLCYVLADDQLVLGAVYISEREMVLHQKLVKVAVLHHLYVVAVDNQTGLMQVLLNQVLRDIENRYLLTMVASGQESLFEPFGFVNIYQRQLYQLKRSMIAPMDSSRIRLRIEPEMLNDLYRYFTQYFTGYFVHNENDVVAKSALLNAYKGNYIALLDYDEESYSASCHITMDSYANVFVDEILYRDQDSLMRILSFVLAKYPRITISSTVMENYEKSLGATRLQKVNTWMVRLNQPQLFSSLYKIEVNRVDSAMKAFSKPLFNSDFY